MTLTAVLVTGVLAGALYVVLLMLVRHDAMAGARQTADRVAHRIAVDAEAGRLVNPLVMTRPEEIAQVVDRRGKVVAASEAIAGQGPIPAKLPTPLEIRKESSVCGYPRAGDPCMLATTFRVFLGGTPFTIIAAVPEPGLLPRPVIAAVFGTAAIATVTLRGVSMWWSVGRTLEPVKAVRTEMDQIITATDLHRRVPVPGQADEIQRLAISVNATLDRLERAVEQQRRFVSDVSHELRSPITALQTGLESAAMCPEETDASDLIQHALAATERLQNIVEDVLVLARREARIAQETERFDLAALIRQEVARRPRRVPVNAKADDQVDVEANRTGIIRVITNLLDNAARHADSVVEVRVARDGGHAVVEVRDDGDGIPAASRERVFERFVRLEEGRRRDPGGSGLGLAISREIVRDHGGSLTLADSEEGACFVLRLPAVSPGPAPASA
ncbi:sensor histidine kinase [Nonomuraea sp. NPDC059194]|uniref:sensor histidine kinase n=1 Tax=Nonomuraea sp. NPDC059194 TaxID=3346764 RepID=UPI0036840E52